jgi:Fe-S-cluster containining protein
VSDPRRLADLVADLAKDPAYATGRRSYPRTVTADDAIEIAEGLEGEVERGVEARARQIARQGMTLACRRGCNGCCEEPIMVFRPEALAVARWLADPERAAIRERFLAAYPRWKETIGDAPARLAALSSGDDADAYRRAHIDGWRKRAMCPFNQEGDCTIYPVRPMTCRNAHAVDTSDRCSGASPEPAARVTFVPLDQFLERSRRLLAAVHNAIGGPKATLEPLPDAVKALL